MPEGEVEAAVADWFARLHTAGSAASKRPQVAISAASRLIDPVAAAQGVERWVEQLGRAPAAARPAILEIVEGFAGRVPESDAERAFDRWWEKAVSTAGPTQSGWVRAVLSVAGRLPVQSAERILSVRVAGLIESSEAVPGGVECALCEVARRIPEGNGRAAIQRLMKRMGTLPPEVRDALALIVAGAAERVAPADAREVVRLLQKAMKGRLSGVAGKLADALEEACRRLPENEVFETASSILGSMKAERGGLDEALARAVLAAAKRVHERDVERLVGDLLTYLAKFDESVRDVLERAAFAALTRCPETDVRPLIAGWVRQLSGVGSTSALIMMATLAAQKQMPRFAYQAADGWLREMLNSEGEAVEAFAEAAHKAAGRIAPSEAQSAVRRWRSLADSVQDPSRNKYIRNAIWAAVARLPALDARQLIDEFCERGEDSSGLRVASHQPELAARVKTAKGQGACGFEYCWRTEPKLVLDPDVEFAPPRVKSLLATTGRGTAPASADGPAEPAGVASTAGAAPSDNPLPNPAHSQPTAVAGAPCPDLVLVTVNAHESQAVHAAFREATGREAIPVPLKERLYHDLGSVNGTTVYHAISEMGAGGSGGMQQTVERVIGALKPGAVIAVGIAFGVNEEKQAIGDILVSKLLRLYDLQRVGTRGKIVLRGARPDASPRLMSHFRGFAQTKWGGARVRIGVLLTGDKLVDDVDYRDQLLEVESEAEGGEMEGAGLYASSYDNRVDWIVIKAICDWADGNKCVEKAARQQLAARNAAEFVVESLRYAPLRHPGAGTHGR